MNRLKKLIHHLFIPHEGNNFRSYALHIDFLTYYLIFAIFLSFGFKIINGTYQNVLSFATDITIDKLYQLTNNVRQQNNVPTLTYNENLSAAAQKKAADMLAKNYWAHYAPNGTTPWDFILSSNYQYEFAGENLAKNFMFSQGVVDAWMNSPSHKENLLRKDYTDVGFAIVNGTLNGEQTTLVVQMFGKPMTPALAKINTTQQNTTQIVPTTLPTEIPKSTLPIITPRVTQMTELPQSVILAQNSNKTGINFNQITLGSNIIFLSFLVLAIILDFYFASKLHIIRIGGKNLAHLIFIGFLFLGLLLITKGAIL